MSAVNASRFYVLYGSFTAENGFKTNRRIGVVAKSIEQAIIASKEQYPDLTVWDINHHGEVHTISPESKEQL